MQSDLEVVRNRFDDDPDTVVEQAMPNEGPGLPPPTDDAVSTGGFEAPAALGDEVTHTAVQPRSVLEAGLRAVDKIRAEGEGAQLDDDEAVGLEAIVHLTARPAILFALGRFGEPPPPWGLLEEHRVDIEAAARSVGRINVAGQTDFPYGGTGFLVAESVVLTNCHVASLFVDRDNGRWSIRDGLQPSIDFAENPDADPPDEIPIEQVIGIHERVDLAVLRVAADSTRARTPLAVTAEPPADLVDRRVYTLGYPAWSPHNDAAATRQIFGEIFNVKRLQPGASFTPAEAAPYRREPCSGRTDDGDVFYHDSSTLGGNSGSCVVDLETNNVIGLHYAGLYAKYNIAVALWTLKDDPLIALAGVEFC